MTKNLDFTVFKQLSYIDLLYNPGGGMANGEWMEEDIRGRNTLKRNYY